MAAGAAVSVGEETWVAGVDGCRGGWLVVLRETRNASQPHARILPKFADVLALSEAPSVIAVDMPIGLPDVAEIGGRIADREARKVLGQRQSSVFAVPSRHAVMAEEYRDACARALASSNPPRKVAKQTFNIFPKIREIDRLMTPELQSRAFEVHPEVAFWALNGERSLDEPKKLKSRPYPAGLALRRKLLIAAGFEERFLTETKFRASDAGEDDLLDACACAWSAGRILAGTARTFPPTPPLDGKGLRQEINA
ncbi:MAG: DUF429 domain-containing protein [Proteobacteria bacterium]|nr:DUF429 domain-containing protein [Pseudomonadota bacterium]